VPEENLVSGQNEEVQVDPEMDFSGSDQSDFEDVYQIKELDGDNEKAEKEGNDQNDISDMEDS
jgi:hypothetical protein